MTDLSDTFDWAAVGEDLAGSVTLVAGGARGTGRLVASNLLRLGARVAVVDLDPGRVAEVEKDFSEYGDRFLGLSGDCTVRSDMQDTAAQVAEQFGALTGLVYCAGAYRAQRPTLEVDADEWDLILDSNLKGAFLTVQAVVPQLQRAGGGAIVAISSLAGRTSSPFLGCHYSAAKAGVLGLIRHVAKEFGPTGIRANSLCPGGIVGDRMNDLLTELHREQDLVELAKQTPLGRNVHEQDVVGAVLFLLSDLSRFVTGATVDVNGGILTV
ncbi:SDR family NAD(P)-dependent oxidoreductase [Pseudonocardia sp. WMMC193]|uniref:SDR family NAD(P)-dependent oxidoreductase n=1 Tax=Pseudonocardia sp. WMMC193 TaxID=2911965 RepID=UPI001F3B53FC|nr:SDR family NAD(P)-dependent oxidoreductase [Pseudonocardia sp. WMMC193]MCF7547908.1 SDR family oxidoreductase [Pseudonocardia sp. WMMC193]